MFNYNPIGAQPHHTHPEKLVTDKMLAHDPQLKQATVDMQDKAVQGLRDFPADSAFISDEAKRAFEEQDEIKRRKGNKEQDKKKKKRQANHQLNAYRQAQLAEDNLFEQD